jgi:hypothetical protein
MAWKIPQPKEGAIYEGDFRKRREENESKG